MVDKEHKDLPLVPESVLRRRHDLDELRLKKQANAEAEQAKKKKKKSGPYIKKPNTILSMAKSRRNEHARYQRVKKKGMQKRASNKKEQKAKEIELDDNETKTITYQSNSVGAKMVFVIRTREDAGRIPPLVFQVLKQFHLRQPNQGVFVRYDDVNRRKLHMIEPWVVYGPPSEGVVKDLIERRGFGAVKGSRVPLSDNTILEKELGEHNIICIEDLIHEITNVGDSFDHAKKFLWPFQLTPIISKFEKAQLGEKQGKDYGDKGEEIDEYIKRML
jgi:large subunit ribosomal protein L7e